MNIEYEKLYDLPADVAEQFADLINAIVPTHHSIGFLGELDSLGNSNFIAKTLSAPRACIYVAQEGIHFVGAGRLGPTPYTNTQHYGEVSSVMVHPDYRNKGI